MSNGKHSSTAAASDATETAEEVLENDEESGEKVAAAQKVHQNASQKVKVNNGDAADIGHGKHKEVGGPMGGKRKWEKRKFPPRDEISRVR